MCKNEALVKFDKFEHEAWISVTNIVFCVSISPDITLAWFSQRPCKGVLGKVTKMDLCIPCFGDVSNWSPD